MIADYITNASKYYFNHKLFEAAFSFLEKTKFDELVDGKYPIVGENCFAIVNRYNTKEVSDSFAESHKKFIDIQYIVRGIEKIGYTYIRNLENLNYDTDIDLQKHEGSLDFLSLKKGSFAIFFPDDVHMPGIINGTKCSVLKVVVKIAI
jgi:YhcH/YjgK/YiaL family protein